MKDLTTSATPRQVDQDLWKSRLQILALYTLYSRQNKPVSRRSLSGYFVSSRHGWSSIRVEYKRAVTASVCTKSRREESTLSFLCTKCCPTGMIPGSLCLHGCDVGIVDGFCGYETCSATLLCYTGRLGSRRHCDAHQSVLRDS